MKTDNNIEIVKCVLINLDNNTEEILFEREDSKCHFRKDIEYKNYIIQLRLDWTDIRNNEPVLDADIYEKPKSKRTKLPKDSWHHNEKKYDKEVDGYIYSFDFQGLKLRLTSRKSLAITLPMSGCIINDNMKVTVVKKNK